MNREKIKMWVKTCLKGLPALYVVFALAAAITGTSVPDSIIIRRQELSDASVNVAGVADSCTVEAKLFGVVPIKDVQVKVVDDNKLVPGGEVFGIKFFTKGVMIIRCGDIETDGGSVNPSEKAGLKTGDVIISLDGIEVNTIEEMTDIIEHSYGRPMSVTYLRDNEEGISTLSPVLSVTDKKYKTGLWVRDSTAGIGTVTYYNPETGAFAGLGHGICDVDTGTLMPLLRASVVDVEITDVVKGKKGSPGELKGVFDSVKQGVLTDNTGGGVYGIIDEEGIVNQKEKCDIALKDEVQKGSASIYSSIDEDGVREYSIEIEKIKSEGEENKNFVIRVTDEELLKKTGGIVQGMSGSPIIQNGKLVGAVTHVFVNDPTRGYGMFIENMLAVARRIEEKNSENF